MSRIPMSPPLLGVHLKRVLAGCQPLSPHFPAFSEFFHSPWQDTRRITAANDCEEDNARGHSLPTLRTCLYCQSRT